MAYNANVFMEQGGDKLVVDAAAGGSIAYGTSSTNVAMTGCVRAGIHTVTEAQAGAKTLTITTGLSSVSAHVVQVLRSNKAATSDATVTVSGGALTVADGSDFDLTAADVIHWIAVGT